MRNFIGDKRIFPRGEDLIKPVPIIAIIVPIQAPVEGIFLVIIQRRNNIIIGLVEDRVATIPASAYCRAISNKLIPKAIPRNPLIIVFNIVDVVKLILLPMRFDLEI